MFIPFVCYTFISIVYWMTSIVTALNGISSNIFSTCKSTKKIIIMESVLYTDKHNITQNRNAFAFCRSQWKKVANTAKTQAICVNKTLFAVIRLHVC